MYMAPCLPLMVAGWADKAELMNWIQKGISLLLICAGNKVLAQEVSFQLINKLNAARSNELIEFDRAALEKKFNKQIEPHQIELTGGEGLKPDLQFDDLDGDGKWDKLVLLMSFKPNEQKEIRFKETQQTAIPARQTAIAAQRLAHVRQKRKQADHSFGLSLTVDSVPTGQPNTDFSKSALPDMLTEGPAWENDKVGFRIYMDVRNTKDIWGKTTGEMVLDSIGADPKTSYHNLSGWGMDILAVGKSLGAGALAMRVPLKGRPDTLVRLGGINMGRIIYRKIADGPVRAVFQLEYPEWNVMGDGQLVSITEQISIWGGQYFYESRVSVKHAPKGARLVTGIVNLKSHNALEYSDQKYDVLYTFDQQSEHKDGLGMAVQVPVADFITFSKTPNANAEILNTYTADLKIPAAHKHAVFRFYACWEHSDARFATAEGFKQYLQLQTKFASSPVIIK